MNRLRLLHPDFDGFGNSAMAKDVSSKIRTGRPFGGTGFLFHKKFSSCVKPLVNYKHERVSAMQLNAEGRNIILINGYLPYYNTRDLQNQRILYQDTLAYMEMIMNDNPYSEFIFLLDMNCNIYDTNHVFSKLLRNVMIRRSLISSFDLVSNFDPFTEFTRFDHSTGSYTLIDGIIISSSLSDLVSNVRISNFGNNVSDHLPVEIDLRVTLSQVPSRNKAMPPYINWHNLSSDSTDGTAIEDEEGPKSVAPITPAHTGSSNSAHGVSLCSLVK